MDNFPLEIFRAAAADLAATKPAADWYWSGPFVSQQQYGIPQSSAEMLQAKHGGRCGPLSTFQPTRTV